MVGKKVEGNEEQRRAAARAAREAGESPSAAGVTTGASKQVHHLTHQHSISHGERVAEDARPVHGTAPLVRRGSAEDSEGREFPDRSDVPYGLEHERVFGALEEIEAADGGEGVYADDVARAADLPLEETRLLLHDLVAVHKLVTELERVDTPDLGPRFTTKARL